MDRKNKLQSLHLYLSSNLMHVFQIDDEEKIPRQTPSLDASQNEHCISSDHAPGTLLHYLKQ